MINKLPAAGKRVANWLGQPRRVISQLLVSGWSHVTLPTAKYRNGSVYEYFFELYGGKPEILIFDGKDGRYLDQIKMLFSVNDFTDEDILDLGCGNASFYNWLKMQNVNPKSYIGIDFAHPGKALASNARIIQKNLASVDLDEYKASIITVVNVLVYLNTNIINSILKAKKQDTYLIVVDPIPGLFWDAYWGGVELFYRKPSRIIDMLKSEGWEIKGVSIDYGAKWMNNYLFPLSYCLVAKYSM